MSPSVIIIFGCLAMSILAIGIVLFVIAYQKRVLANKNEMQLAENRFQTQLIEATILSEQQEREKIAKNLHDDLGTSLNILRLNIEKIQRNTSKPEVAEKAATGALEMITHAIQDLRMISRDLMPATLIKLGYLKSLAELCKHITDSGLTQAKLETPDINAKIDDKTEVQLYRVTQELINNLLKHGQVKALTVDVNLTSNEKFCVILKHDGVPFTNEDVQKIYALNKGVGLKSIESRIRMIHAGINYMHSTEHGSRIEIKKG